MEDTMSVGRTVALSTFILVLVTVSLVAYLAGQRFKVAATNNTVFVVDTLTGNIDAYKVGDPTEDIGDELKVLRIASSSN